MKKLLSLTLVLMLLFTTISFTSVSAATMEVSLVKADLSAATTVNDYTVSGTDTGKIANPSLNQKSSGTYTSDDGKKYNNARSLSLTTPSAAGIGTALGIASDEKIIKISQDANTSILRFFMGDGSLSAKKGDVIKYKIKVYYTDFVSESGYTKDGVAVSATKMETVPATWNDLKWGYLKDNKAGSARTGLGLRTVATNQWVQLEYTYEITSDTDADLTSYGFAAENYPFNDIKGYKNFPSTIYLAQPEIVKVVEVATNKVAVTKLGEGTVTGDGDIVTGETANLTATPAAGYHFAGWYEKGVDQSNAALLCADATYSFTVSSDKEVVAVFEKNAVNGWIELTRLTFTGDNPANTNLWSKDSAWANVNGVQVVSAYTDAEITAPDTSCGADMLKIDSSRQAKSAYGMVDGRIGYIPGYKVRFEAGKKYRVSFWIYVVSTDKGKEEGDTVNMSWGPYKNGSTVQKADTIEVGKWVKKTREFTADSSWANAYTGLRISPANISKEVYDEDENNDSFTLAYIDEVVFERLDAVEVTAEATNGTVYGTGSYARGENVTLNAGANNGYKFAGYYTEGDELLSNNPTYTFTVNEDTKVVAKFVDLDDYTAPENVVYRFGNETGDVGIFNNWMYVNEKQDSGATYNHVTTYRDMAEFGIYRPMDTKEFGDKLFEQRLTDDTAKLGGVAGRFRGWETGNITSMATKFVSGQSYIFRWWVYPVETVTPQENAQIIVTIGYNASVDLAKTFTVKVGQWNQIEWRFTANDTMAAQAPGIRYDWVGTNAKWSLYDNITVEKAMKFADTQAANGGWYRYNDQSDFTSKDNNNCTANSLDTYASYPELPKASSESGEYVIVFDYSKPALASTAFKPKAGSVYEGMTYSDAYAYLTRLENAGTNVGGRFNNIMAADDVELGSSYHISCKIFIPEVINMKTGLAIPNAKTNVKMTGCHTDQVAIGDGKVIYSSVETGKWVEVGYTFKATEKGIGYAPSFKLDLDGMGTSDGTIKDSNRIVPKFFIDDIKVEKVHVDDLALEISEDDTTVTAIATVNDIKSGPTLNAIVIIAAYGVDGKLISVALSNGGVAKAVAVGDELTATYPINAEENVKDYVAFLWDDLANIRPYVLPVTLGK